MKKTTAALLSLLLILSMLSTFAVALEPAGRVSDAYRASVYYERLTAVELTGDERRDIVNIALSQVGYHEGDSRDDFGGGNLFGKNEYTEYNYFNGDIGGDYSYYWCASFVTYCARQAGIPEETIMNSVSCDRFVERFLSRGEYISIKSNKNFRPQTADFIFFLEDGADREYASHIGIVIGCDEKYVYTVEGNTKRGIVNTRRYEFGDKDIVGYAVPNYAGVKNDYDFELSNKGWFVPGKYIVNVGQLNMRSGSDLKYEPVATLTKGTELILTEAEGDWAKTTYKGIIGWVSLLYMIPDEVGTMVQLTYALENHVTETRYKYESGGFIAAGYTDGLEDNTEFLGWSTTEGGEVEYREGEEIKIVENLTLYPVLRIISIPANVDVVTPPEPKVDSVKLYGNIIGVTIAAAIVATAIILFIRSSRNNAK